MKTTLKVFSAAVLALLAIQSLRAKEENGLRVEVQKTTLSKDDDRSTGGYSDRIDRTLGLKIFAKNTSMKDLGQGKVEWIMIVERWGYNPRRLERYKGTEPMPTLRVGEEIILKVGESQIGGYRHYNGEYQDKIEGWSVTIFHDNKVTMTIASSSSFDRLNAKAKDVER